MKIHGIPYPLDFKNLDGFVCSADNTKEDINCMNKVGSLTSMGFVSIQYKNVSCIIVLALVYK